MNYEKLFEQIKGAPCILCGEKAATTNIFIPKNGHGVSFYGLCKKCSQKPGAADRAEQLILEG